MASPETIEEIIAMDKSGVPIEQIAEEMEMSVPSVYRILGEAGVTRKRGKRSVLDTLNEEAKKEIIEAYTGETMGAGEIVRRWDINYNALYRLLEERGVQLREIRNEKKEAKRERLDRAVKMYAETDVPIYRIVDETGIQQPQLHAEIHRRGLPLRRERDGGVR